jgi:hypothetical protein
MGIVPLGNWNGWTEKLANRMKQRTHSLSLSIALNNLKFQLPFLQFFLFPHLKFTGPVDQGKGVFVNALLYQYQWHRNL